MRNSYQPEDFNLSQVSDRRKQSDVERADDVFWPRRRPDLVVDNTLLLSLTPADGTGPQQNSGDIRATIPRQSLTFQVLRSLLRAIALPITSGGSGIAHSEAVVRLSPVLVLVSVPVFAAPTNAKKPRMRLRLYSLLEMQCRSGHQERTLARAGD